jgi:ATP-dependent Lon protease
MPKFRRMSKLNEKDTGDKKEKSSRKEPNKKKGKSGGNDDDSVDSKGNIRNLIDYNEEELTSSEEESFDYDEEETETTDESVKPKKKKNSSARKPRKAALKARKKIQRKLKKIRPEESEEETEESSSDDDLVVTGRGHRRISEKKRKSRRDEEEEEESTDESETLGSQDTDEEEEEDEDETSEEEDDEPQHADINIHIGSFGSGGDDFMERMIPKRHNLKKETKDVQNFVKLVTKPFQGVTIDDQIDQFKALTADQQKQMLEAMERKPPSTEESLMFKILTMKLPAETQSLVLSKYHSLQTMDNSSGEYFKLRNWLEKLISLPLGYYKHIPVKIEDGSEACSAFMERSKKCLNEAIYGQEEAKLQILQFIAAKIANPSARGLSLLLAGPPGIGKCHAKDTPILMFDGTIKRVQDIVVDDMIMGDDSTPRKVLSLGRGKDTMYDITPEKGESYRVNSEHILCLKYSEKECIRSVGESFKASWFSPQERRMVSKKFSTKKEAETHIANLEISGDNILEISVKDYLKLPTSIQSKLKGYKTAVDCWPYTKPDFCPYILGLWLADSSSRNSMISHQDSEVLSYLRNTYNTTVSYHNPYDYNMSDTNTRDDVFLQVVEKYKMADNKHIPNHFKINSRSVRLELLAGLIDSDGHLLTNMNTYEISTTNVRLKDDIVFLARSVGFATYAKERKTSWQEKGEKKEGKVFRIRISGNISEIPVLIERKKPMKDTDTYLDVTASRIKVTEAGFDDYYGFTLDDNHRYVMGDFTVTHNTSLIKNGIAKALGWPFQFISLGGDSDATTYTGHQVVYEGSHSGKIANSLVSAKSMSMILMFDELDKISTTAKGEEVQNMLIHLTDPVQNSDFEDKYLSGIPLDLSHVMFVFSANDINKIDKVLLDRMMVIQLKGYKKEEKIAIAENFLIPGALREVNLSEKVGFSREVVEHILNEYATEETGVRELRRCIEQIIQKINVLRIFNNKELPFHIPNFTLPFVIKKSHIDLFLKKKQPQMDESALRMYS